MITDSIRKISFKEKIWNAVIDGHSGQLYLDIRASNDEFELVRLDLSSLNSETQKVSYAKWTQLIGVNSETLYFIEYQDAHNPNQHVYFSMGWNSQSRKSIEQLPPFNSDIYYPSIYEYGSRYHKTVSDFLSLELPHSCEYFEWNDKIIISYYLRSGNAFDRYLLLLAHGVKEWKICQDTQMKGFAPGAFFVFQDQLIFIKDQNEVCVYTG